MQTYIFVSVWKHRRMTFLQRKSILKQDSGFPVKRIFLKNFEKFIKIATLYNCSYPKICERELSILSGAQFLSQFPEKWEIKIQLESYSILSWKGLSRITEVRITIWAFTNISPYLNLFDFVFVVVFCCWYFGFFACFVFVSFSCEVSAVNYCAVQGEDSAP